MPEKSAEQPEEDEIGKPSGTTPEESGDDSLGRDQRERRYYYDDATGYEWFDPENDSDDEEVSEDF